MNHTTALVLESLSTYFLTYHTLAVVFEADHRVFHTNEP